LNVPFKKLVFKDVGIWQAIITSFTIILYSKTDISSCTQH
jgi:hypothetical protein